MSASKLFSNSVTSLHEAIKNGEIDEVKSLLSKLPVDKNYFDAKNNSAAAVAIKCEKFEIYELLVANGIFLGPHEMMDELTSGQEKSQKRTLRDIHRRYLIDPSLKHLMNMIRSTKLSHEASPSERREHLRLITEAFEDLNGLKSIEPILKIASTSSKLKIIFDFNRDSVEFLDPMQNRYVEGLCYTKDGIIYVGAKGLKQKDNRYKSLGVLFYEWTHFVMKLVFDNIAKLYQRLSRLESLDEASTASEAAPNRYEVLGVLIHELTHFAMKLIYDNEAKPYRYVKDNQGKITEFSQVFDKTEAKKKLEPKIEIVYDNYLAEYRHAELIVRVPHLTALYKDDEEKTIEVQENFSELFDFYEKNTLVDLTREFPLMEVKHEIRELNELCGILTTLETSDIEMSSQALDGLDLNSLSNDRILLLSSNYPQLTLKAIFQQVCANSNFETSFIFADSLTLMKNEKIFDLAVKALALSTHPSIIIDCKGDVKFEAVMRIVERFNERNINQKVIFIVDKNFVASSDENVFKVVHSWNHLTNNFQQNLLQKKVEFQGTEMVIEKLLNDLSSIDSIPFQDLLDDQTIVIGKNKKFETKKSIERKFLPSNSKIIKEGSEDYTIEHDLDEILALANEHQMILLSDEPGMGKSTSVKMLYLELKQKHPSLWLVLLDLKKNFEAYQISCLNVNEREDIAKFLTEKVLKIKSFEAQLFTQLFNKDRVVLFMDGLDEICPTYKQFIFSLMKDIQKFSKNQLWISTRPHLVDELKKELNPIMFTLKPFTKANRRNFIETYVIKDRNSKKLKKIGSFLGKIKSNVGRNRGICNPLILEMIVEILGENQDLKLSEENLFLIYEYFTKKMVRKCNTEKGAEAQIDIANSYDNSNVVDFYQQQAFLTCFTYRASASAREKLIDPQFDQVERPLPDEICRVGLMYANSSENLRFIHRTFAEFYVAKFFYEVIFKFTNLRLAKYLSTTIEFLLKHVLKPYNCNFIRILLDNALDSYKRLTVKKFPLLIFKDMKEKIKLNYFNLLVRSGCYNLIDYIVSHLHPDGQKLLFSKNSNDQNSVMIAVKYQSVDFIKRFFDKLTHLNADEFKNMFFERDIENRNAFFFAASNLNSEVFKYIVKYCESLMTNDEYYWKILLMEVTGPLNYNLLQYAVYNKISIANLESLLTFMRNVLVPEDKKEILLHEDSDGLKAFDLALASENEEVFDIIRNFYLEVFRKNGMQTIIFNRSNCDNWIQEESLLYFKRICSRNKTYYDGAFKRFVSFVKELFAVDSIPKKNFLVNDEDDEIFLKFAVLKLGKKDFTALCSLFETNDPVEMLQRKDFRGECAFHWAAKRNNLDVFHKVRLLYEDNFDKPNFRQMIVNCDKSWIVDVIEMNIHRNSEIFKELCDYLKELFKGTEEAEMLKNVFLLDDETGQTAFMAAARGKNKEFKHLFALAEELYNIETVKEFLLLEDVNGATAFTHSFIKGLNYSFEFVKRVFEKLFDREKMQEIVLIKVRNQNILSHSINLSSRLDLFEIVCNYLIQLFEGESCKLKNMFTSVDYSDETVLMKAAKISDENYFKILVNVIENFFVEEEIMEMLCQKDRRGKTAFHFSIGNKNEDIFETVRDFYIKTLGNEALKNIILAKVDWTDVLKVYNLDSGIKRLVPLLKLLFGEVGVHLKDIFFKRYEERTMIESVRSTWNLYLSAINASTISYLETQFQDDAEVTKTFIKCLESSAK